MNNPLLGLDVGFKRTGVALSESGIIAQPLTFLEADPPHMVKVIHQIVDLVKHHEIKTIIAGLPYTEDGNITLQSGKVEHFLTHLSEALQKEALVVIIERVNEYYSTQEAQIGYPDAQLDAASAALILQEYINSNS